VAVYGEFSASDLARGPQGDYLYGGTTGVLLDGPILFLISLWRQMFRDGSSLTMAKA
jgi:hypothetical protein